MDYISILFCNIIIGAATYLCGYYTGRMSLKKELSDKEKENG